MFKPYLPCHLSCLCLRHLGFCGVSVSPFLSLPEASGVLWCFSVSHCWLGTQVYWLLLIYWLSPLQNLWYCLFPILSFFSCIRTFFSSLSICSHFNEVSRCIRGKRICSSYQFKLEIPSISSFFYLFIFLKVILFIYLFIYWLRWVFVAARRLSLVAVSRGYCSLWCAGFSLQWLLLLWSTGSRCAAFSSCSTRTQ